MGHRHGRKHIETKNVKTAFFLNLGFTIIEIAGGLFTNSMAILSDAAHDLGDSITLGSTWYLQRIAGKKEDDKFTYGYLRYSVLGAAINIIILSIGCVFILVETIPRLMHPEEVHSTGMLLLSLLGILINYLAMRTLQKGSSLNEQIVSLHFLEDVLGWVAVLVGSIIMMIWDIPIIDPILSLLIACYILYNVFKNTKIVLDVLLQRTPRNIDLNEVKEIIRKHENVLAIDDIHVWSLDGEYHIASAVVVFKSSVDTNSIEQTFKELHQSMHNLKIEHITFEPKFSAK